MSFAVPPDLLAARLELALGQNELPIDAQKTGYRLLNRLRSPVRVAIFSLDGHQGASLANAIAGAQVLPAQGTRLTTDLAYGERKKTTYLSAKEVVATVDGHDPTRTPPEGTERIRFDLPISILRKMSLCLIPLSGDLDIDAQSIDYAQDRCDIALWCTHDFSRYERDLWSGVGGTLRANSYLTLTNADTLFAKGQLDARTAAFKPLLKNVFFGFFATAPRMSQTALARDGRLDDRLCQASGIDHVRRSLLRRISVGLSADEANAAFFLKSNKIALEEEPAPRPKSEPSPASVPEPAPVSKPISAETEEPVFETDEGVLNDAIAMLQTAGQQLDLAMRFIGIHASSEILAHCLAAATGIAEMFAEADDIDPDLDTQTWEIVDMLTLMQVEGDERAAADAVSLLLQMRRDIEAAQQINNIR